MLFENIKNQKNIEILSELVINKIVNKSLKKYKKYKDIYNPIYLISALSLNEIDVRGKGFDRNFQKYIKTYNLSFKFKKGENNSTTKATYIMSNNKYISNIIEIYLTDDDLTDLFEDNNMNYMSFYGFLIKFKNSLIHELQHSFDDWRSDSKYLPKNFKNREDKYTKRNNIHDTEEDIEDKRIEFIKYAKSKHEISAFFTGISSELLDYSYTPKNMWKSYDVNNWSNVMNEFKIKFPAWDEQSEKTKKRLIQRLYILWSDKFKSKHEDKDITNKLETLVNDLRTKYDGDIYIHYSHHLNQIKIQELNVKNIETEREIYIKLIKLADTYKKTITVSLYKNYTTKMIGKAKNYLKEFGFFRNHKTNTDYKFMDEYVRYSKRKRLKN